MLTKIFFEFIPCARHDAIARVDPGEISAEDESRERKRQDVATGGTAPRLEIDFRHATPPNENAVVRLRMFGRDIALSQKVRDPGQKFPMRNRKIRPR